MTGKHPAQESIANATLCCWVCFFVSFPYCCCSGCLLNPDILVSLFKPFISSPNSLKTLFSGEIFLIFSNQTFCVLSTGFVLNTDQEPGSCFLFYMVAYSNQPQYGFQHSYLFHLSTTLIQYFDISSVELRKSLCLSVCLFKVNFTNGEYCFRIISVFSSTLLLSSAYSSSFCVLKSTKSLHSAEYVNRIFVQQNA